jgi:putative ABC transport system permease protein
MPRPAWVTSVRRRPAAALALALLAALAVLVSVLAPTLLRAVQQVSLAEATAPSEVDATAIVSIADVQPGRSLTAASTARSVLDSVDEGTLWDEALVASETGADVPWVSTSDGEVTGSARVSGLYSDDCGDVEIVEGSCPAGADQLMVPSSVEGVRPGDVLTLAVDGSVAELEISGRYDETSGDGRFLAAPSRAVSADPPAGGDLVVTRDGFDALLLPAKSYATLLLARPLRLDDLPAARAAITAAEASVLTEEGAETRTDVRTGLTAVLDRVGRQADAAAVIAGATALQALALAWFAQALVVQRLARVRSAEWGLARLRGIPRSRWLGSVFLEPAIAILAGAVIGAVAGSAIAFGVVRTTIGPDVPVEPLHVSAVAAAVLALVGSLVALVVASLRSARQPLDEMLARTAEPRRLGRFAAVVQAGLALVTVTVLAASVLQGDASGPGLALLAPSLVAVLVGVVGVRVATLAAGRTTTRPPRSLAAVLVGRRLGRTPSALTTAILVCLGVAIAAWSTQVAVTADRLQIDRARAAVGATTALEVSVPTGTPFVDAVRAADPGGERAMAVDVFDQGNGVGRIVAVDTERLGAVSTWSPAWSDAQTAADVRRLLAPPEAEPIVLTGSSVSITLSGVSTVVLEDIPAELSPGGIDDVSIRLTVQADDGWHTVNFGSPRDGTLTSVPGRFPCDDGCRVVWFGATSSRATAPPFGVAFTLEALATDRQPAAEQQDVLREDRWRDRVGEDVDPVRPSEATVRNADDGPGLALTLINVEGENTASISPLDAAEPLPAIVADGTRVTLFPGVDDAVVGIGPDLSPLLLVDVGHTRVLPRIGGEGVMVDLASIGRVTDPALSVAAHEVWLAPLSASEESRVRDALAAQGIEVTGTRTVAADAADLRHESTTRAGLLGLVVGGMALLLTLATVVAVRVVSRPSRISDMTALADAGVPRPRLRRIATLEMLLPASAGAVLGLGAGLLGFVLTVVRLPLVVGADAPPPADLSPSALPLVALGVGTLLLLVAAAVLSAHHELPRSRPPVTERRAPADRPAPAGGTS